MHELIKCIFWMPFKSLCIKASAPLFIDLSQGSMCNVFNGLYYCLQHIDYSADESAFWKKTYSRQNLHKIVLNLWLVKIHDLRPVCALIKIVSLFLHINFNVASNLIKVCWTHTNGKAMEVKKCGNPGVNNNRILIIKKFALLNWSKQIINQNINQKSLKRNIATWCYYYSSSTKWM